MGQDKINHNASPLAAIVHHPLRDAKPIVLATGYVYARPTYSANGIAFRSA